MNVLDHYRQHTRITDPREGVALLDTLPDDFAALHETINGLLIHIWKIQASGEDVPVERKRQYETRSVARMLAQVYQTSDQPLTVPRPPEQRLIVDCRHFAVFLCGVLRHRGIPARARCGFATYLEPDPEVYMDHWICEYWNGERWVMEDADTQRHDVKANEFVVGGRAWQMIRNGEVQPERFHYVPGYSGAPPVRDDLVRDLAALAGFESLSSDGWGIATAPYETMTEAQFALLDRTAALTVNAEDLTAIQRVFESQPEFCLPRSIVAWSYADDALRDVDLMTTDTI